VKGENMDNQELIWVTKEQAKIFNELGSDINKKTLIDELISRRKVDIQSSIESLDDDLLRLKAFALTYKTELKKVYDEQDKALQDLWESSDAKIHELKGKIQQLKPELQNVKNQIDEVNKFMNGVSTYGIDKLIEMVHKINNMSEADKKLITDLINLTKMN
jgi:predicted  nucleic acid-binding Zn-ribbon protein